MNTFFTKKIIHWYLKNKRELPWRSSNDPYIIWLSEIILQQTRVEQGLPYFNKFLESYPTVYDFNAAGEDEILKLWQGLGYYSRARNMIVCADTVVTEYDGKFPDNFKDLNRLKGIGKYTAAAIASISFKEAVPVVDGNVYRVLSRFFGIEDDLSKSKTFEVFFQKALALIDRENPDIFNQGMMEFGALYCTPKNPDCNECMFGKECFAYKHGLVSCLPVKTKKIKKRIRYFDYLVLTHENNILIHKRLQGDIWNGLYDFLLLESDSKDSLYKSDFYTQLLIENKLTLSSKTYKHILTHQTIYSNFHQIDITSKSYFKVIKNKYSLIEINKERLNDYPIPVLIDKFLKNEYI